MFQALPYAPVPEYLSRILCFNTHDAKNSFRRLFDLIQADKFLQILIEKGLNKDKHKDLQQLFHTLGLRNFRNQLTALYLEFYETGKFSFTPELDYIQDLITFEDRFETLSCPGGNRLFLLGLYLKLADSKQQSKGLLVDFEYIQPPQVLDSILRLGKSGQEEADYLVLLTWQLLGVWGEEQLKQKLQKCHGDFKQLLSQMDSEQRGQLIETMLVYSASINQDQIFKLQAKV